MGYLDIITYGVYMYTSVKGKLKIYCCKLVPKLEERKELLIYKTYGILIIRTECLYLDEK